MNAEIDVVNKFVLYNMEATQPWAALYEEKWKKWDSDKKAFKQSNGRRILYVDHLKENMPNICPDNRVVD